MTLYAVYRNLTEIAPSLTDVFQKLDQSPDNPRIHFELGTVAHQSKLLELARDAYFQVTQLAPRVDVGFFNLGNVLFELQRFEEAKEAYGEALRLAPESGTLINLGNCSAATQDWDEAVRYFDQALARPDCSAGERYTAYGNRGKALTARGSWDAAIENYQSAINAFPRDAMFRGTKAKCHQERFEYSQAMASLIEAIELYPTHPGILCQIADINFARGRTTESLLCLERAFSIEAPSAEFHSHWIRMLAHYPAVSPERLLGESERWASIHTEKQSPATPASGSQNGAHSQHGANSQRVRVGFLVDRWTGDAVGNDLAVLLAQCSSERIDWFVYCNDPHSAEKDPSVTAQGVANGVHFIPVSHLSDDSLATKIQSDRIDVLIDQIGHGQNTRLRAIARKPAPIQIAWNAFPTTTGVPAMDYILADSYLVPDGYCDHFSERILRLPKTTFPYALTEIQRTKSVAFESRRTEGEPDVFTIGCLSSPETYSEEWLQSLGQILKNIDNSVAIFVGPAMNDHSIQMGIQSAIEQAGVLPTRVSFHVDHGMGPVGGGVDAANKVLERDILNRLDVSLDPFPLGSTANAFTALASGVPVVTKLEERMAGRGVAAILNQLGKDNWISGSEEDYVQSVVRIARERNTHRQRRDLLRSELVDAPMCNLSEFASSLEQLMLGLTACLRGDADVVVP